MTGWSLTAAQAAIPAIVGILSTVIGFIRVNGRAGRLRSQAKETLELAKIAEEAKSTVAKERLDGLVVEQLERLRVIEWKDANHQYDKASLGVSAFLLIVGVPAVWALFLPQFLVTDISAWILIVFLAIFVPFGVVRFFTGDPRQKQDSPLPAAEVAGATVSAKDHTAAIPAVAPLDRLGQDL